MPGAQDAWSEVGERFAAWGRLVAQRYNESSGTAREATRETERKLEEAAREVTDVLDRAFTALGETIRDEQAKADLKGAVKAFGDAVAITVSETSEQIRRRVGGSGVTDEKPAGTDAGGAEEPDNPNPA
jgi:hypothetical protein